MGERLLSRLLPSQLPFHESLSGLHLNTSADNLTSIPSGYYFNYLVLEDPTSLTVMISVGKSEWISYITGLGRTLISCTASGIHWHPESDFPSSQVLVFSAATITSRNVGLFAYSNIPSRVPAYTAAHYRADRSPTRKASTFEPGKTTYENGHNSRSGFVGGLPAFIALQLGIGSDLAFSQRQALVDFVNGRQELLNEFLDDPNRPINTDPISDFAARTIIALPASTSPAKLFQDEYQSPSH